MLPPKRKRERVKPDSQWVSQKHRRFVKAHHCSVPGCMGEPIEFAHARRGTGTGMQQTPHDWFGISLCAMHHREQHTIGEETFEKRHGFTMLNTALKFASRSPAWPDICHDERYQLWREQRRS